jgi:hypothetical protein
MVFESKGFTETIFDSKGLARKIRQTKELAGRSCWLLASGEARVRKFSKSGLPQDVLGRERAWPSDRIAVTQPLTSSMAGWVERMGHRWEIYIPGGMRRLGEIGWVWGLDRVENWS